MGHPSCTLDNIGSGNGLLLGGTKTLPQQTDVDFFLSRVLCHSSKSNSIGKAHLIIECIWILHIQIQSHFPHGTMSEKDIIANVTGHDVSMVALS